MGSCVRWLAQFFKRSECCRAIWAGGGKTGVKSAMVSKASKKNAEPTEFCVCLCRWSRNGVCTWQARPDFSCGCLVAVQRSRHDGPSYYFLYLGVSMQTRRSKGKGEIIFAGRNWMQGSVSGIGSTSTIESILIRPSGQATDFGLSAKK